MAWRFEPDCVRWLVLGPARDCFRFFLSLNVLSFYFYLFFLSLFAEERHKMSELIPFQHHSLTRTQPLQKLFSSSLKPHRTAAYDRNLRLFGAAASTGSPVKGAAGT